ncbi:MAG: hypothetical protein M1338_04760, partial [Patescibacteria group bacterium]|nr:hypothetical protein [Patescibacteria group bacterium]
MSENIPSDDPIGDRLKEQNRRNAEREVRNKKPDFFSDVDENIANSQNVLRTKEQHNRDHLSESMARVGEKNRKDAEQRSRGKKIIPFMSSEAARDAIETKTEGTDIEQEAAGTARTTNLEKTERFRDPQEAVDFLSAYSHEEWRKRDLDQKYGKGLMGEFKKFIAGEYDFDVDEGGEVKKNTWKTWLRIGAKTLLNKQVATGALSLGVVGLLTGGIGLGAGAATFFGTAAGRGVGEAWAEITGEGKLREEIARAQYGKWYEGRNLAKEITELQKQGTDPEQINNKIAELVQFMYEPHKETVERQEEYKKLQAKNDKIKNGLGMIGGMAGLATHMALGGLKDMLYNLDIDGNHVYHNVQLVNDKWHFIYNGTEAHAKNILTHEVTSKGVGWADYLWGVGKNFARDFAVLGATFWASKKNFDMNLGGKSEKEITESKKYEKESLLKSLGRQSESGGETSPPPAGPEISPEPTPGHQPNPEGPNTSAEMAKEESEKKKPGEPEKIEKED